MLLRATLCGKSQTNLPALRNGSFLSVRSVLSSKSNCIAGRGSGTLFPSFGTGTTKLEYNRVLKGHMSTAQEDVEYFGRKKQTQVSLRALMETGAGKRLKEFAFDKPQSNEAIDRVKIQIACFLHRELPIRLAHRALELEKTPEFAGNKPIGNIAGWYRDSFSSLRECPAPTDLEKESKFADEVNQIFERHSHTLITMALGAHQLRQKNKGQDIADFAENKELQQRLDDFYMSRIGIRMLIGQYLALRQPANNNGDMIGLISLKTNVYAIAQQVVEDATYMCERTHGDAPEVIIHGNKEFSFPYVPSHIQYMLLELLKNSMRATVETHGVDNMPPIRIVIAGDGESNEDVIIKVSDEGGGIPRSNMHKIWSYLFTTADPAVLDQMLSDADEGSADFSTASPLAGLGYGIPISRNYARYFGGDLTIMSMEGYGTDSFIYLPRLHVEQGQGGKGNLI